MKKWLTAAFLMMICMAASVRAEEYHLVFHGDWDQIQLNSYQSALSDLFETTYPRLYARWGMDEAPATIYFNADAEDHDSVAYSYSDHVVVAVDYANRMPSDLGYFSHELTHCIQSYNGRMVYGGDAWWTENMANYGGFRYYHWADISQMEPSSMRAEDWMDWGYQPYGNCQWFFAYMDDRYPTQLNEQGEMQYGLIDSIHRLILSNEGEALDDDPYDPSTPMNKTVYAITGYESIEALRLRFAEELEQESWRFNGFEGYSDNFITENLSHVKNPEYPSWEQAIHRSSAAEAMEPVTEGDNLCRNAHIFAASGFVNELEAPELLIDGNFSTKWCSTLDHVTDMTYSMDGTLQWIVIDLGAEKLFNTYTVINTRATEPYYGNMVCWELLVSCDGENWLSVDYQPCCDMDQASFHIGQQSARYLLLRSYDPDNGERGTIRLYELMLFQR